MKEIQIKPILMKRNQTKWSVSFLILMAVAVILSGCQEKDYYDPTYKTENPMGDIQGPDGFKWKTTLSVPVTVKVNDEMVGEYYYLVEVFNDDPLNNPEAGLLAKGVAKKGQDFSSGITVTPDVEIVYIQQTDPKGRIRVMTASTGGDINCVFQPNYIPAAGSRAGVSTQSEVNIPQHYVTDEDYINAEEWDGGSFKNGKSYKISTGKVISGSKGVTINGTPVAGKENLKLYIAGTWNLSNTISLGSGMDFVILDGGEVVAEEFTSKEGTGNVVIMPGGTMEITKTKGVVVGDQNAFYQLGTLKVPNGTVDAQNGDNSIFYIGSDGLIEAKDMQIHNDKTYIENHGHIKLKTMTKGGGAATIYNMCVIEAEQSIDFTDIAELYMDGGIVIAPQISVKATPVNLRNGAMFKCDKLIATDNCVFTGLNVGNRSLVKVKQITNSGGASVKAVGHVTLENNTSTVTVTTVDGADKTKYDDSNIIIEGCKVKGNPGNDGKDPKDPEFPIVTPVTGVYTYIFEDNWPFYGDYDLNDVVFRMDNIKTTLSDHNYAQKYSFDITYLATGAEKRAAGALMLDMVEATNIKSVSYSSSKPSVFQTNQAGVEEGQSKAVIPLFHSIHDMLGKPQAWFINTMKEGNGMKDNTDPVTVRVEIEFVEPILAIDLNVNYLNYFIITDLDKYSLISDVRREIHLVGFEPTQKVNREFLGKHNDNSLQGAYYLSVDNLAWGVVVPDKFKWMIESNDIQEGYSEFESWVTSGGTLNKNWWKGATVAEKIY